MTARYTVSGQDNDDSVIFTVVNGKMTWTGSPVAGKYTLKIEDQSGKYASVEVSFVLSTSNVPVQVQANEDGSYQLAATENVSENQVKAYVKSITAVKVEVLPMQRPEEELLRSSKMTVPLICLQKQMVNISLKVKKIPTFPLQQQVIHRLTER